MDFEPDNLNLVVNYDQVKTLLSLGVGASAYTIDAFKVLDREARILWDIEQNHLWCVRDKLYGTPVSNEAFDVVIQLPTKAEKLIYLSALYN